MNNVTRLVVRLCLQGKCNGNVKRKISVRDIVSGGLALPVDVPPQSVRVYRVDY